MQWCRALPGARNRATGDVEEVPCVEVSFALPKPADVSAGLTALYEEHAYEEPVIVVTPAVRTLHLRGMGRDAPVRFRNRPTEDWVPQAQRP